MLIECPSQVFARRFLAPSKYAITRVMLEYDSSGEQCCDTDSTFWKNEERFWEPEYEENECNITWIYKNRLSVYPYPSCVSNVTYRVSYSHDGKLYRYVTRNHDHAWPPKKVPGFNPPIKDAVATMYDGTVTDVLKKFSRYAGPNSDFHGETLHLSDVVGEQCVSVTLTNILGKQSTVKSGESFSRATLW